MKKIKKLTKKKIEKMERRKLKNEFVAWAVSVKARDNNVCAICGSSKLINAHHIVPREIHPLRFNIDNGIALCPRHHKFSNQNSPHKNPFTFFIWFNKNRHEQQVRLTNALVGVFNDI